jgi:hypothetical protein
MNMGDEQNEEKKKEVQITASEEIKRGVFANQAVVSHSTEEFVIDFIYLSPSGGTLNSRVIVTPGHFKRLIKAMDENLTKYEDKFGEIFEKKQEQPLNG